MSAETNRLFRPDEYERRSNDFYPTPAWVTQCLLNTVPLRGIVWEPCAGQGAMAKVIADAGLPGGCDRSVLDDWHCVPGRGRRRRAAVAAAGGRAVDRDKPAVQPGRPAASRRALVEPARTCRRPALPAPAVGVGRKPERPDADVQASRIPRPDQAAASGPLAGRHRWKTRAGRRSTIIAGCWNWNRDPTKMPFEISAGDPRLEGVRGLRRAAGRPAPGRRGVLEPLSRDEKSAEGKQLTDLSGMPAP